jgi:hypothetical protein
MIDLKIIFFKFVGLYYLILFFQVKQNLQFKWCNFDYKQLLLLLPKCFFNHKPSIKDSLRDLYSTF